MSCASPDISRSARESVGRRRTSSKSLKKKKVIIYPIAFTIDNSETEFELDVEYREIAEEIGFEDYRVAKAPNDHPSFVKCITNIYESMKKPA